MSGQTPRNERTTAPALPRENYEDMFDTLVRWARFSNIFAYEDDADWLSLRES